MTQEPVVVDSVVQQETRKTIKNFKTSTDVEDFYRFINDHDLRKETKIMLDIVVSALLAEQKKRAKAKKH